MADDWRKEGQSFTDALRFSLLTSNPRLFLPRLFPELAEASQRQGPDRPVAMERYPLPAPPIFGTDEGAEDDDDLEPGAPGSFDFSSSQMTEEQVTSVLATMLAKPGKLKPEDIKENPWR